MHNFLSKDEIISNIIKVEKIGIYFLVKSNEIVYVGQSKNIPLRIATHENSKDFDSYFAIGCEVEFLNSIESYYIHTLKPAINLRHGNGKIVAPMSIEDAIKMIPTEIKIKHQQINNEAKKQLEKISMLYKNNKEICPICEKKLVKKTYNQRFCCVEHKIDYWNRLKLGTNIGRRSKFSKTSKLKAVK